MKCDRCGGKIRVGGLDAEPRYTIADSDDGSTGRHYGCHEESDRKFRESVAKVPELTRRIEGLLKEVRRKL